MLHGRENGHKVQDIQASDPSNPKVFDVIMADVDLQSRYSYTDN